MLVRYFRNADIKLNTAKIYTKTEHGIDRRSIDLDARSIINRLRDSGYEAYLVGGSVRDLLIGQKPKDFDIVTGAHPALIRRIFRNSRIIGRRFRLVHVYIREKLFEVSTFRAVNTKDGGNEYGKMEEDAVRRDFSVNALYYCPRQEHLIDFVSGFDDITKGLIRSLQPLPDSFQEDPVRMIRAVKYAAFTGFSLDRSIKKNIRKNGRILEGCSSSRLTEEFFKIIQSGKGVRIFRDMNDLGILPMFLPGAAAALTDKKIGLAFYDEMERLDNEIRQRGDVKKGSCLAAFLDAFFATVPLNHPEGPQKYLYQQSKVMFKPLTPPNSIIDEAVRIILKKKKLKKTGRRRVSNASAGRSAE